MESAPVSPAPCQTTTFGSRDSVTNLLRSYLMKTISLRLSTLIVVLAIGLTLSASAANPIIDWNQIALTTALTTPGTQIYLTYVNLAMYDAVNAIDGRYQQYA